MNRTRIMTACYGSLIGIVLVLMVVPLAACGIKRGYPAWDQQINDPKRFIVLSAFGGAAVLDLETGLVWEQSPETAPGFTTAVDWYNAHLSCLFRTVGGRKGWRLPLTSELASLIDPTQSNPALPSGHPFSNVQSSLVPPFLLYWSATTDPSAPGGAFSVFFSGGGFVSNALKTGSHHLWCVRGGQGVNPQ
jgi:hypothetical protein